VAALRSPLNGTPLTPERIVIRTKAATAAALITAAETAAAK
jgi:hypothetical protein